MFITAGNQAWLLDDEASSVVQMCQTTFGDLLNDLCEGNVLLGHLETTLRHGDNFKRLYTQCKSLIKLIPFLKV